MGEDASDTVAVESRRPRSRGLYLALALLIAVGLAFGGLEWRKHSVNGPVETALAGEPGAQTVVYRRELLGGNDLVFDVQSASGGLSMTDMTRRLFKTAEALKGSTFDRVYLASKGRERFYLDGAYFKQIGEVYGTENPVYTLRTMPENVHNLDGTPAFERWTGGLLGVFGQQMNDVNEFHRKWWADDALASVGS
jgi:hypothetical protein